MQDKKFMKRCEAGYFVYGVCPIAGGVVFVETEMEAQAILDGAAVPDQVIRVVYTYMTHFAGMALPKETLVTEATRMRFHSDEDFAKRLKRCNP